MEIDIPSKTFPGVRFVLFGFDPINEQKVRSKLIDGGGVDVGQYSQSCSHVIVDKLVYDDPLCVAARSDGKTLVTALWVDHSFDVGIPVDATSIMYRPLKDLNGIPGAKCLVMCLTGYQRQDRDDIMTMVGLMGAHFSKPLVANKVTHLICYKFEGEKYELAKKIKKIKLVNHRWLEDCLRDWELLPEANYDKSGYELEMMEIEAKDSEEEAEDDAPKRLEERHMHKSPHSLKAGMPVTHESPKSAIEVPVVLPNPTVPANPSDVFNANDMLSTPSRVTKFHQTSSFDNFDVPEIPGCQDIGASRNGVHETTPKSAQMDNDWASASKTPEKPSHSESKFSSISYTRKTPRRSPQKSISLLKEVSGSVTHSPLENSGVSKVNDVFDMLSSKVEYPEAKTGTDNIKTPQKGGDSCEEEELKDTLPPKRMTVSSGVSCTLKKISHIAQSCDMGSSPVNYKSQVLESKSSLSHPLENNEHFSPANKGLFRNEAANVNATVNSHVSASTVSGTSFNKKWSSPHSTGTVTTKTRINDNPDRKSPSPFKGSNESPLVSEPNIRDFGMRSSSVVVEAEKTQNEPLHVEVSSPRNRDLETEKSNRPVDLDLSQGGNHKLVSKPVKMKKVGKKTLGTKHTANRKGSIYLNKSSSLNDSAACLSEGEERTNEDKFSRVHEPETSPVRTSVAAEKQVDAKIVMECGNGSMNKTDSMNDETEAADEKDELEFEKALNSEMAEVVELPDKEDIMKETEPGVRNVANDFNVGTDDDEMAAKEIINGSNLGKIVCGKKLPLDESTTKGEDVGGKIDNGKKRTLGKAKAKTVPAGKKSTKLKKVVDGEGTLKEKKMKDKVVPRSGSKSSGSTAPASKLESSLEKENRPAGDGDQNPSRGVGKSFLKATKATAKLNKKVVKVNSSSTPVGGVLRELKSEPLWFIFRGHRLQRKEFQQIVRRLKGRFCRDSHQWSYQATHFIAPDPLCRTEKFFAAAASGRWILKTDYLSACSQAGKFLAEEPYEWHKKGLSEDGAINLEAPRKWRLLRESTGHGAFYGMRIIIYGECIAPPLDTLKRVVKAGDGEILATSPPYTRFLKSGVDFAVVSPGMPRVDMWVQEFLKHEVPCVVADYLVEFVCKPGYPLEKHVLYNTHAWAEKSFANLVSKADEVVLDSTPSNGSDSNDVTCEVCGSADRGEVMLICGDESGSVGCGVGTHIDCCDPPLRSVPDKDWFCSKCNTSSTNPSKKQKK